MNLFHSTQISFIAALLAVPATTYPTLAQTLPTAQSRIQVHAPYAQQLILAAKEHHPEVQRIGLHAVPPGLSYSVVIANTLPGLIGQKDSAKDIAVERSGKAKVERREEGFYKVRLPIDDIHGQTFGMIAIEVPFKVAGSEDGALKKGEAIRTEIQHKVPNKNALFSQ